MTPLPSRRRALQLLLAALPLSSSLGADRVRSADHGPAQPVRVLMPAPFADAMAPAVARFNRLHPGEPIAVTRGPLDTEALSDLASGSLLLGEAPFDLLLMDISWTPRYAAAGWLMPLEPLLGPDAMAGLVPEARLGNAFDGHLWRMPLSSDAALLYWRTDLLPRPPRDLEELVAMARELQRQGSVRWGHVWQGRQYEGLSCVVLETLHAFGARWWDAASGRTDLLTPQALAATTWANNSPRATRI